MCPLDLARRTKRDTEDELQELSEIQERNPDDSSA